MISSLAPDAGSIGSSILVPTRANAQQELTEGDHLSHLTPRPRSKNETASRKSRSNYQSSKVAYFASIAVTSTSIIMYGQASWGTLSNVDAGIGASPNASFRHF